MFSLNPFWVSVFPCSSCFPKCSLLKFLSGLLSIGLHFWKYNFQRRFHSHHQKRRDNLFLISLFCVFTMSIYHVLPSSISSRLFLQYCCFIALLLLLHCISYFLFCTPPHFKQKTLSVFQFHLLISDHCSDLSRPFSFSLPKNCNAFEINLSSLIVPTLFHQPKSLKSADSSDWSWVWPHLTSSLVMIA